MAVRSNWYYAPLTRPVIPRQGPLRVMWTLTDAREAIERDLPLRLKDEVRWATVRRALELAATLNSPSLVERATGLLEIAMAVEGWTKSMTDVHDEVS